MHYLHRIALLLSFGLVTTANATPVGQAAYVVPGTYSWTAPAGVTSVCVVCVGPGSNGDSDNGGGGGGLGWKNNIPVTPGNSYTVGVGAGGGYSYFINTSTVLGAGADGPNGGGHVGDGGGDGGGGGTAGGGAGGYSGNGGSSSGFAGSGGGGGGGGRDESYGSGGGGGGVGIYGQGSSGAGGSAGWSGGGGGGGGSGGASGGDNLHEDAGNGGGYGGGGGSSPDGSSGSWASGAVRIIWGSGRAFPSTNTQFIFVPFVITSSLTATATAGYDYSFSYQITASLPATSYIATGLPAGFTLNTATGLISGTTTAVGTYNVSLTATNAQGTCPAATLALTVAPHPGPSDTMPPTVPSGLTATFVTATSLRLSWNASTDNVGVWNYEVVCNGRSLGTTTALSKIIVGLSASTSNSVAVRACDVVGNWSAPAALSVTTAPSIAIGYIHSLVVRSDGSAWAWGYNYGGLLGDGTTTQRTTPVAVSGLTSGAAQVAAGYSHSLALKSDGTVWWWGNSGGPSIDSSSTFNWSFPHPVRVSTTTNLTGVVAITAKWATSAAVKADGTLWLWSGGESGPTQVTQGGAPFTGVVAVAVDGSSTFTLALKSDGTVWSWGYNPWNSWDEDLGWQDGWMVNPVQVSGLYGVVAIATESNPYYKLALKSDGTVWAWDYYDGNGNEAPPAQVSGLSGIVAITEQYGRCLALKNDGTVWMWTQGWWGQTGAPIQMGGLTGASAIAANYSYCLVAKNDGTVRAWGSNSNGQLGDGTTIDRMTPVAVSGMSVGAPTNLNYAEETATSVTLVWRASTDSNGVGVVGYNVYRNGTQIGTTSELAFADSGLRANTGYSYAVKAFDAAGNLSAASNTLSVTTTADFSADADHDGIPNATETALGTNGSAAASPDTTNQTQQNIHRPAR